MNNSQTYQYQYLGYLLTNCQCGIHGIYRSLKTYFCESNTAQRFLIFRSVLLAIPYSYIILTQILNCSGWNEVSEIELVGVVRPTKIYEIKSIH